MPKSRQLREKAEQCRRLAARTDDDETARVLSEMATEYEARALIEDSEAGKVRRKPEVLLVDDEESVLEPLVFAFEEAGFAVATATNALAAHTLLEDSDNIDLVVTDVRMPGSVDGLVFGQVVRQMHPDIPIIVMSGACAPDDRDIPPGVTFIAKPFKTSLLLDEAKLLLQKAARTR